MADSATKALPTFVTAIIKFRVFTNLHILAKEVDILAEYMVCGRLNLH